MRPSFRVQAYGDVSYFRRSRDAADAAAQAVMARNGCGNIQQRQASGTWKIVARFEPWYGIVPA